MTDALEDLVDVEELPEGPIDRDTYWRLVDLVGPDAAYACGRSREFLPPDMTPREVWAFRFHVDGEWFIWHYCSNCEEWERVCGSPVKWRSP